MSAVPLYLLYEDDGNACCSGQEVRGVFLHEADAWDAARRLLPKMWMSKCRPDLVESEPEKLIKEHYWVTQVFLGSTFDP